MVFEQDRNTEPCYVISIAARMVGLNAQTLRYYERVGLLSPSRSLGRQRIYSQVDVQKLRRIKSLTEEMGLNLAGAEIALRLMDRVKALEQQIDRLKQEVQRLESTSNINVRPSIRRPGKWY